MLIITARFARHKTCDFEMGGFTSVLHPYILSYIPIVIFLGVRFGFLQPHPSLRVLSVRI